MNDIHSSGASSYSVRVNDKTGRIQMPPKIHGIDLGRIIEGHEEAENLQLRRPDEKLKCLNKQSDALKDVQEKMTTFHKAVDLLQGANVDNSGTGVFGLTKPTMSLHNGVPGSNYFSLIPKFGASPTEFDFEVLSLAHKDSLVGQNTIGDPSAALNLEAVLTFADATASHDINIMATDSAYTIRDRINALRHKTNIEAEVIPSNTKFKLVLKSQKDASPITFSTQVTAGDVSILPASNTSTVGDLDTAANLDATLTFTSADPVEDIVIDPVDSPNTIRDKINARSDQTNVSASIISIEGVNRLVFSKVNNDQPASFTTTIRAGDGELIPRAAAANADGLKAQVRYRGESSLHPTNQVVIAGNKFQVFQTTTTPIHVTTNYDRAQAYDAIKDFVVAYNDARDTVHKYSQPKKGVSEEENKERKLLSGNPLIEEINGFLTKTVPRPISGIHDGMIRSLNDIGVTTTKEGVMEFDGLKLNDVLQTNFEHVKRLFVFDHTSTNPNISITGNPEAVNTDLTRYDFANNQANQVTLTVQRDADGDLSATLSNAITADTVTFGATSPNSAYPETPYKNIRERDGVITITVNEAGPYRGFTFTVNEDIANGASTTSDFTLSQGIGDRMVKFSNRLLSLEGQIHLGRVKTEFQLAKDQHGEEVKKHKGIIKKIEDQITTTMARIQRQYDALTRKLAQTDGIKASLKALDKITSNI